MWGKKLNFLLIWWFLFFALKRIGTKNCWTWKFWGENMLKTAMGNKVKIFFQGVHITCVISMLVYNFKKLYFGYPI